MRQLPQTFSQRDPRWATQRLGTVDGTTIGQYGCYISSFAMVADYYGKNVTPASLDDIFTNIDDPSKSIYVDGNECTDDGLGKAFSDIQYVQSIPYPNDPADLGKLRDLLSDPSTMVILEVDFDHDPNDGIQTHFVVAVDCDGENVTIADPWQIPGSVDPFTKNYGNNPAQTILKFVVYKGTPAKQGTYVDAQTFEELVSKSTEDDAFHAAGYTSVDIVKQKVQSLQTSADNANTALAKAQTDISAYEHTCALLGLSKDPEGNNPTQTDVEQAIKALKDTAQQRLDALTTTNGKLKIVSEALGNDPARDYDLGTEIIDIEKARDAAIGGYTAAKKKLGLTANADDKAVITTIDNLQAQAKAKAAKGILPKPTKSQLNFFQSLLGVFLNKASK